MSTIVLERFAYTPMGVFGRLRIPHFQCFTVECPWLGNEPWISCIPEGEYDLVPSKYYQGDYDTYQIVAVPGRSRILIHVGNTMDDLRGCIAPGSDLGYVNGKWGVVRSRIAFKQMMVALSELVSAESIKLSIVRYDPSDFVVRELNTGDMMQ